jgi:hypothetical protein
MARTVALIERVQDPRNWALLASQVPPAEFVDFHRPAEGFEVGAFDEVRAYHRRFDRFGTAVNEGVDGPGCAGRAIAADGTLCPSIVLPSVPVSIQVARELVERFNGQPDEERVVMCLMNAHHAFVFYREGIPVGELLVDFHCPRWSAAPGYERSFQEGLDKNWLVTQCEKLGLAFCDPNASAAAWALWSREHAELGTYEPLVYGERIRPRPIAIDLGKPLSVLTSAERRLLCVWNTQHLFPTNAPARSRSFGVGQDERRFYAFPEEPFARWSVSLSWDDCVETFPSCGATVGEVLPCMDAAQRGDPWFALDENAFCRRFSQCLWGFVTGAEPNDAAMR